MRRSAVAASLAAGAFFLAASLSPVVVEASRLEIEAAGEQASLAAPSRKNKRSRKKWFAGLALAAQLTQPIEAAHLRGSLEDVLLEGLEDPEWSVRRFTAELLGELGPEAGPRGVAALEQMLVDQDWRVRWEAAESLLSFGDNISPGSMSALGQALHDENLHVRLATVEGLSLLGEASGSKATPVLIEALRDDDLEVRWTAATALGELGKASTEQSIPALELLLQDKEHYIRQAAAQSLRQLGRCPECKSALPA